MKTFVSTLLFCLVVVHAAAAQEAGDPCSTGSDERAVHEALLAHFQVMEGTIKVAPLGRSLPTDGYDAAVAPAVADFNRRNAGPCPAIDGPFTGAPLFEGPQRTRLSRVGFDAGAATAFAEITMIGGPEFGSSHYVVLKRQGHGWAVSEELLYRMF